MLTWQVKDIKHANFSRDENFCYHVPSLGGTLHFIKFQTQRMGAFLQVVEKEGIAKQITRLACTGGGAHKFEEEFKKIGITVSKLDEMNCLVQGAHFLFKTSPEQVEIHLNMKNRLKY